MHFEFQPLCILHASLPLALPLAVFLSTVADRFFRASSQRGVEKKPK